MKCGPATLYLEAAANSAANPDSTILCEEQKTIRWAVRIKPGVAPRTLRRAFEKVTDRHESLRLKLVSTPEGWGVEIPPKHPVGLVVEDYSHLSADEQDAAILARGIRPLHMHSEPMFEMVLIKCGSNGDVVLTRAHHAVIDGYSMVVVIEELLKIVLHLPLSKAPPTHADFVAYERRLLATDVEEKTAFWHQHLLPLPDDLMIGRAAKGLRPISAQTQGKTIRLTDILSPVQSEHVEQKAKTMGLSPYPILYVAFAETICALGGGQQVLINSVRGRQDGEMAGFVGSDIQPYLVKYCADDRPFSRKAAWVADQVAEGAAHLPTNALDPGSVIAEAFAARNVSTKRFLIHIGHPSGRLSNSPFKKLFDKALGGQVRVGALALEQIHLLGQCETSYELNFLVGRTVDGWNGSLVANAEGFRERELEEIGVQIRHRLDLDL